MNSSGGGPTLTQLSELGSTTLPPAGWTYETAMDMEYVHAMAPRANIILYDVDPNANNFIGFLTAVLTAENNPAVSVITASWQFPESDGGPGYDVYFTTPGTRGKSGVTNLRLDGGLRRHQRKSR